MMKQPATDNDLPTSLDAAVQKFLASGGPKEFYIVAQDWLDDLIAERERQAGMNEIERIMQRELGLDYGNTTADYINHRMAELQNQKAE